MKCKKTIDARKYSHDALEEMRISAVLRVEAGESPEDVAKGLGINRRTIYRWISAYHYGGPDALKAKPIPGAPPKLTPEQMSEVVGIVRDSNPLQHCFEFALWTLAMVRELIAQRYGVRLSEVSVGRLLRRFGLSPQRPLYRAYQQDAQLVESWRQREYPALAARAKRENALIFFADESGIRSDYHAGTTWGRVGRTPVVKSTGERYGLNMLSAVNAQGHFRFMTVNGSVNATVFIDFLERLLTGMERKVFLVVDGHPSHKAKMVRDFVQANQDRIELFFLPPYSPQLNPDELAWAHVKGKIGKAVTFSKTQLIERARQALADLAEAPHLVRGFFHAPTCAYAKE